MILFYFYIFTRKIITNPKPSHRFFLLSGGCSTTLLFLPYFIHTYTFEFFSLSSIHLSIRSFVLRPSDYCDGYIFSFFSFFLHAFLFFILSQLIRPDETPEQVRSFIPSVRCRCCSCVKSSFLIYNILLFCVLFLFPCYIYFAFLRIKWGVSSLH